MSDFVEIEDELKKLQPVQPSDGLLDRVENAIDSLAPARSPGWASRLRRSAPAGSVVDLAEDEKVIRPDRFRINLLSVGIGLAAAASLLIFARLQFDNPSPRQPQIAANSPAPVARSTSPISEFLPAGATQVVYHTRDEGLLYSAESGEPMRRVRSRLQESLQWRNAATGASLRVSYPSEQVELIPVSGQ